MGRWAAPVVALVLLTILPPAATAAPVREPAVEQYVESVPGAGGDGRGEDQPGSGGGLPSDLKRQIERDGGADAQALETLASSRELGAPATAGRKRDDGAGLSGAAERSPSALDAVGSAALGGGGSSGGWVLAGIALLTAVVGGTALARRSLTR
jgi:hypothetical protein